MNIWSKKRKKTWSRSPRRWMAGLVLQQNTKQIIRQHASSNGSVASEQVNLSARNQSSDSNLFRVVLVDVPAEFDVTSSLREDVVDHQIVASKVECIELLRLKPIVSSSPWSSSLLDQLNSSHWHHVNKISMLFLEQTSHRDIWTRLSTPSKQSSG